MAVPGFYLPSRLLAIGQQVTPLLLVSIGQTFAVLTGGLDLSVGAVATLSLVLASGIMRGQEAAVLPGVLVSVLAGAAVGFANGLIVTGLRISPLIATLATMSTVQGIAWVYTHGAAKGSVPESIRSIANGYWGPVPVADVVFLSAVLIGGFILARTVFGRHLYATGANLRAATLAGVPTRRAIVAAYVLSGVFAALGGLVLAGYVGVGSLDAGDSFVLDSIAAVIIGGTSFSGGQGGAVGTAVGVWILAVLTALLIQLQTPVAFRPVLLSLIIVVAAILHARRDGR